MHVLMVALFVLLTSGVAAFVVRGNEKTANLVGLWGCVAGCVLGVLPALFALRGGATSSLRWAWSVPGGSFYFALDALSAFFLVPILGLSLLGAVYGIGYRAHQPFRKPAGGHWLFYNVLVASMAAVVTARNGLLFLVVWEVMALASFFLVTTDDERESVRNAGWTYLVATHLGTAFLFGLFALLGQRTGSLDFDQFTLGGPLTPGLAAAAFLLAVVGFGAKAGFVPFHVWLPEAHPAAPSHVSALMSGVMIKTGMYGLLRTLTFLGPPPAWWGWVLVLLGVVCAVFGILFALAQHDLKRLLAYSSVENIGIITLGLGTGVLGMSAGLPTVAALGFAGALLHVLNHAVFKGLLFFGAGSILHATETGELDRLGGLLKRMPKTGLMFLVGAAAISGLPPLNGFVGEFLIFMASFHGANVAVVGTAVPMAGSIAGLALASGLAVSCFTKVFGVVFLGEPRSEAVAHAHDPGPAMGVPQAVLAVACVAMGLLAPALLWAVGPAVAVLAGTTPSAIHAATAGAGILLRNLSLISLALFITVAVLVHLRNRLLAGRTVGTAGTWDCGYAAPTARMQYTASSYAQPITDLFHMVLRTRKHLGAPLGLFPEPGELSTATPDVVRANFYVPLFKTVGAGIHRLRWLQHGNLHLYVLYIAITLLALLVWKLG